MELDNFYDEEEEEINVESMITNLKSTPNFKEFVQEIKKIKNTEELKDAIAEFYIDLLLNSFIQNNNNTDTYIS